MNKEQTIWKRLSGKSRDLVLTRRSGTLRRSEDATPIGANAVADYAGGLLGGQANEITKNVSSPKSISAPSKDPIVQATDATRVQKPIIYPIYSK